MRQSPQGIRCIAVMRPQLSSRSAMNGAADSVVRPHSLLIAISPASKLCQPPRFSRDYPSA